MIHQRCFESSKSFRHDEEQRIWWQKCPKSPAEVPAHTPHRGSCVALPSLPADLTAKLSFSKRELLGQSVEVQSGFKLMTSPVSGRRSSTCLRQRKGSWLLFKPGSSHSQLDTAQRQAPPASSVLLSPRASGRLASVSFTPFFFTCAASCARRKQSSDSDAQNV